ncbi:MAG: hypothetical protein CMC05_03100 [Flavobacteriaceae bacterium]|nr:hypothetical protein [Flavobacteriaceae bacterium]MBD09793.1 hypothetical protein [Flavobacteriaceae bacterium]|tara:strand:- start:5092 stop:5439 length:348 start_codon:yes stop_codon:yes gene_type:complete
MVLAQRNRNNINIVIKSLTVAVLQNKPKIFLYHLLANNIETTFPNKLNFYKFFTRMLKCAYKTSKGKLHLKIENPEWEDEGYEHYCFYDNYHKHSRLNIKIKESNNKLIFNLTPF